MSADWYFTAPWDPVSDRRGDALGFRAGADYFAELLAPGLSNSTSDARWISLLSWCLQWSHVAWQRAGGGDLARRDGQRERYEWMRPLELLWGARTLVSGQATGQIRGRNSIKRWLDGGRRAPNFAMSSDQFRRYRQVGTYGAYRVALRSVPGLTTGDGWTPAETGLKLAELVNNSLPSQVRLKPEHFEGNIKWALWRGGNTSRYWVERGWRRSLEMHGGFLPTSDDAVSKKLPEKEREILESALFSPGSLRRATAMALARAKNAQSHAELCDELACCNELLNKLKPGSLASLPGFTRIADAAMNTMRALWAEINCDESEEWPEIEKLARSTKLPRLLNSLRKEGSAWLNAPGRDVFPHTHVVTSLAEAMGKAATPADQLRALARHHAQHGGGLPWFREQDDRLRPLVRNTGIAATDYRFRLRPLLLLASQCGVANMKAALNAVSLQEPWNEEVDVL